MRLQYFCQDKSKGKLRKDTMAVINRGKKR